MLSLKKINVKFFNLIFSNLIKLFLLDLNRSNTIEYESRNNAQSKLTGLKFNHI